MRLKEALESRSRAPNAPSLRILPRRFYVTDTKPAGRKSEHFRLSFDAETREFRLREGVYRGRAHFAKQLAPPPIPASLVTFLPEQESNVPFCYAKFSPQGLWNVDKFPVDNSAEKSPPQSLLKSY